MKNKTLAAWLALLGGPFGLHRFYLKGGRDWLGWLMWLPTVLGLYGLYRARHWGVDDVTSWLLLPLLGITVAACALNAIVYGLMGAEQWNAQFNTTAAPDAPPGHTHWLTIGAVVLALLLGATALMASIAFSFQRYFEYQADTHPAQANGLVIKKSAG